MTQLIPASQTGSGSRGRRTAGASLLALALSAGGLALAGPASATVDPGFYRIAGEDRYGTSAAAADYAYDGSPAAHVVVASGDNFPDGLSASAYAGAVGGPVLLVPSTGEVPATIFAEMDALSTTDVTIIGGTAAVSTDVEAQLVDHGLTVDRIAGADRYSTSAMVAAATGSVVDFGTYHGLTTAFLATGQDFADALAASAPAYSHAMPVLLTPSDQLASETASALADGGFQQVIVMGGDNAISPDVAAAVAAEGIEVTRISGVDRNATATALADVLLDTTEFNYDNTYVTVTSGTSFADALSTGPYAGYYRQVVLFAEGSTTDDWIVAHNETVDEVEVVGGPARISDDRIAELVVDATIADTTAPTLLDSTPADGADAAPIDTVLSGSFDEPLAPGSSVTLTQGGAPVAGVSSMSDATHLDFAPSAVLDYDSNYVMTFTAVDAAGNQSTVPVAFHTFID